MRLSRVEAIEIEPAVVRLTVEVPPEEVQSATRHLFNRLRRLIHVRGFRPGRAPIAIIRRQVGDENIRARLLEEIIPKAYAEALEKEQLQPLMLQRIQLKHFEEGDRLEFEAEVAIRKPVELGDYRNIRIQPPSTEVTDEDIERALDELREQYPTYEPDPEHVAVRGDRVLIRYTITPILSDESAQASAHANGEVVEGETDAERDIRTTYVTAGEGHWFPPFNNYVLGKRAGDEAEHELTFPDDFPNEQLRGRRCKVWFKVEEVQARKLPSLDDEFARMVSDCETLDELREKLHDELWLEKERSAEREIRTQIEEQLLQICQVTVPRSVVEALSEDTVRKMLNEMQQNGIPVQVWEQMTGQSVERLRAEAMEGGERALKLRFILEAIAEREGITVSDAEVEAMARSAWEDSEFRDKEPSDEEWDELLSSVRWGIMRERVMDFLVDLIAEQQETQVDDEQHQ